MTTLATNRLASPRPRPRRRPGAARCDTGREVWGLLLRLFEAEKPTLAAVCQECGLTAPQAYLLRRLQPEAPIAMSALASAVGCDASNITGLVDRLEARGFIERRADVQDRRVKMIAVTRAGAEFRLKLLERMLQPPPSLAALPERTQRALRDILREVVRAAERAPGPPS